MAQGFWSRPSLNHRELQSIPRWTTDAINFSHSPTQPPFFPLALMFGIFCTHLGQSPAVSLHRRISHYQWHCRSPGFEHSIFSADVNDDATEHLLIPHSQKRQRGVALHNKKSFQPNCGVQITHPLHCQSEVLESVCGTLFCPSLILCSRCSHLRGYICALSAVDSHRKDISSEGGGLVNFS